MSSQPSDVNVTFPYRTLYDILHTDFFVAEFCHPVEEESDVRCIVVIENVENQSHCRVA